MNKFLKISKALTITSKQQAVLYTGSQIRLCWSRKYSCSKDGGSKVGFIGLGNMGSHMATNLIKGGKEVVVFDLVASQLEELKTNGASIAQSPAHVASQSDCIVTMLPSSPNVISCYTEGDDCLLSTVRAGTLIIDSSTIDAGVSQEMSAAAKAKGAVYMDAPVSGGIIAAKAATLTFMVGGPADRYTEAETLLSLMGKNMVHCGDVGTGQAAKICNNMLLGISMIGVSEAMNLGISLGLDPKLLASILNTSSGRCWSSDTYNPCPGVLENTPSSNGYKGGFGTALMTKDLGLAQNAATETKTANPLGSLAHQLYRVMCNQGYENLDFSSVYKFLKEQKEK
ncbi:probable 3-hydroxyisobutyrate dehydrogenase, mitochondrial [Watersipora subatra]|uniref:probable 3-hydroxyisobutyrate dehydrogenase, mitochondrial n=1 Tax=Watersipora subatra TaxID=2589382 RepID=UPI00355C30DF